MKTQRSQKLQISNRHLKDNNNKINHHSRERGSVPVPPWRCLQLLRYRGSQWGLPRSFVLMVLGTRVGLLSPPWPVCSWACFPSLLGVVKCSMKPGRCSCVLRDWAPRSRPLGTWVCSGAELNSKWLNPCLAVCPETSQGPLWSLLLTVYHQL